MLDRINQAPGEVKLEVGEVIEVAESNGRISRRVITEIYEDGMLLPKATPDLPLCARRNQPIM